MKRRQSGQKTRSVKNVKDIDRSFVVIPEMIPDHWRENLDVFFDENETGLDHVRYMMDINKADVDRYYFTGGYEIYHLLTEKPEAGPRPKKAKALTTRLGNFTMPYKSNGCFRYALPE